MKKKMICLLCIGLSLLLLSSCSVAPERPAGSRESVPATVGATTAVPATPSPGTIEPTPPVTTEEPTPVHPDPNREKKDILSIPGAMLVENPVFVDSKIKTSYIDFGTADDMISFLRRDTFVAIAEMENLKCYVIPRDEYAYYLITFDLRVTTPLTNIGDKEVLENCIMGWRTRAEHQDNICALPTERASIMERFCGVYTAQVATNQDFLIDGASSLVNGPRYYAGDYADYYVDWRYDHDEDSFDYDGIDILFDDIRR